MFKVIRQDGEKNIIPITIFFLGVIILVAAGLIYFSYKSQSSQSGKTEIAETDGASGNGNLIGGQTDEYGCLGPAGYSWCAAKQKCLRIFEEFCPDRVDGLAKAIEEKTGVRLTADGDTQFNWRVSQADKTADTKIYALKYAAKGVSMADYQKIEEYLNGIAEIDSDNLTDGTVGGLRGYYLDYMACDLNFRWQQAQENTVDLVETAGDRLNISLECGYFNKNDIDEIILAQQIKELFAKKYNKSPDSIEVTISILEDDHLRGGVLFLDEEFTPGAGGNWLAAKVDGEWKLVFDGNGSISCELLESYGFPETMMTDCSN